MKPGLRGIAGPVVIGALMPALLACDPKGGDVAGGSVVENEVAGMIRYADGTPAAGATVQVYAVAFVPGSEATPKRAANGPLFSTRTDAGGRYVLDSLPKGEYNILGRKGDLYSSGIPSSCPRRRWPWGPIPSTPPDP